MQDKHECANRAQNENIETTYLSLDYYEDPEFEGVPAEIWAQKPEWHETGWIRGDGAPHGPHRGAYVDNPPAWLKPGELWEFECLVSEKAGEWTDTRKHWNGSWWKKVEDHHKRVRVGTYRGGRQSHAE